MPVGEPCTARLKLNAEKGMSQKLCHRRLPPPRPFEITRRCRECRRKALPPCLRPRRTEVLIERCRAENMQIPIRRPLLLPIGGTILGQRLPRTREALKVARRHREVCLRQKEQALQFPMPRDKHGEEQQQKPADQEFCCRAHIITVNQNDQHRGKDKRARKNEARALYFLRALERERIFTYVLIEQLLQSETSSHFAIILIIP